MPPATASRRVPVTILTGFLGSGKTTLLNHILAENHGLKVAVIVNEFGDIGIDGQLIVGLDTQDGIVELSNGCICCSINTDLYEAVLRLLRAEREVDYLLVETTGVADPRPVAQTFFLPELERQTVLDSVIAVVDAVQFPRVLHESAVAAEQVTFSDFVVLNKASEAYPEALDALERQIRRLNPYARILRADYGRVPLALLIDVGAFALEKHFDPAEAEAFRRDAAEPHDHGDHHDHHDEENSSPSHLEEEGFVVASFVLDRPLRARAFQAFLETLPPTVYRGKGILWFLGEPRRAIFQQVGSTLLIQWGAPWDGQEPMTQLVFIGKEFDKAAVYEQLRACVA